MLGLCVIVIVAESWDMGYDRWMGDVSFRPSRACIHTYASWSDIVEKESSAATLATPQSAKSDRRDCETDRVQCVISWYSGNTAGCGGRGGTVTVLRCTYCTMVVAV